MTVRRWSTRRPGVVPALLAGLLCASLVGCGSTVAGHPVAVPPVGHVAAPLPSLLPRPTEFPPQYTTVVLGPEQAREAAADLTGIPAGSQVEPVECAAAPADADATMVGTNDTERATITVELRHTDEPLAALRGRLRRCAVVRARHGALATTVVTQWDPLGSSSADEALAVRRTVAGPGSAPWHQTMQVRVGQVKDVRISATYLTFTTAPADIVGLERVFAAAVAAVRGQ